MADKQNLAKKIDLNTKQDVLIAGQNITIAADGKTISAANPTSVTVTPVYQAGTLVAAIVVNGNTTNIYAPAQHGDNANQNLALPFNTSQTYEIGDFVIYEENLYQCITAIDTPAAWDSTKWTRALITDVMEQGGGGDYANQNIANTYSTASTYAVGDYVIHDGLLYKCVTAVTTPGVWNASYWEHCIVTDEMGGGGNTNYVELTQTQYDALTPTQQMDGTIYLIKDGGGSGSGSNTYYGTTEPSSTLGENGDTYVLYDDVNEIITAIYIKIEGDWLQTPTGGSSGGSHISRKIITEGTFVTSNITITGEVNS